LPRDGQSSRLEELKVDAMFKHHFQDAKPAVSRRDLRTMSEHFDDIASGKVRVE
jgi:hypothetical protein